MQNKDISDVAVLEEAVKNTNVDFEAWQEAFENPETEQAVVRSYFIQGAPALVINQKYLIRGAQRQEVIEKTIEKIAEEEGFQLQGLQSIGIEGEACRFENGQWVCD